MHMAASANEAVDDGGDKRRMMVVTTVHLILLLLGIQKVGTLISRQVRGSTRWRLQLIPPSSASLFQR